MRHLILATGLALAAVPSTAQHDALSAITQGFVGAIDANDDGAISRLELLTYGQEMHGSMDSDGDGSLSEMEVRMWEFGSRDIAVFRDRAEAYDTAIAIMFDMFDRSHDGAVSIDEFERGLLISAEYADANGDSVLSREEYTENFIFSIAVRNVYREAQ